MSLIKKYTGISGRLIALIFLFASVNALLLVGVIVTDRLANGEKIELPFYFINEFTGVYTVVLLLPLLIWFFNKFPIQRDKWLPTIILYLLVSVLFGLSQTSIMYSARVPLYHLAGITRLHEIFNDLPYRYLMEYFKQLPSFWLIYLVYWAIKQYQQNQQRQAEEASLKEELLKAQLQSLQMQLQPHFFFNTLNTISSIMYNEPERADKLISRMSGFLRNVIGLKNKALHSLEDEWALLRQFADVMLARYPDKLCIRYEVSEECLDVQVPVLLLQPILENAIKYSIDFQETTEVVILISPSENYLNISVSDNGPGIREGEFSQGTGLSATMLRLKKLYGDKHHFSLVNRENGGLEVEINIPIV